jgi:hypothetical protein
MDRRTGRWQSVFQLLRRSSAREGLTVPLLVSESGGVQFETIASERHALTIPAVRMSAPDRIPESRPGTRL